MSDEQLKSRYRALVSHEFKSMIPPHLLGKLGEQERYIVESLSKLEQQNTWLMVAAVEANAAIMELDTRQTKVEIWKDRLTSKWAMVLGACVLLAPVLFKAAIEYLIGKKVP